MASQSLYRKWRSQTFDDLVGQEPIIDTLKNALITHTLSHAYLFSGPRGTGKTSTARLLAKTVNCLNPHDGEPCNTCQQCRDITMGNSFNVIEIDAASNRGIDSIRELREKVMVPPATGKYKIYILDEAHMLTTEAFNALLKTLEEPPDYVIFVMATTDVHKMLPTVISRCQCFAFKRISTRQIVAHLLFVAKEEKIELVQSAAELIARSAAGGMRDALSLLDQAIAYAGETIALEQIQSMLGVADPRAISKLITFIASQDSRGLLHLIHELSEAGADLRQINVQMIEYWRALMLAKAGADAATILDLTEDEFKEVQQLVPAFTLEELINCSRIFAQNDLVQKNQAAPQLGLELAALECTELHRKAQAGPSVVQASTSIQAQLPAPAQPSRPGEISPTAPTPIAAQQSPVAPPTTSRQDRVQEASPVPIEEKAPPIRQVRAQQPSQHQVHPQLTLQQIVDNWENVRKRAKQKSGLLAAYLQHWQAVGVEGSAEGPVIVIQAINQRHFESVKTNDRSKDIEWALSLEFNRPCKVRLMPPGQMASLFSQQIAETTATRPVAHLEPPSTKQASLSHRIPEISEPPVTYSQPEVKNIAYETPAPVARQQEVRENKKVVLSPEEAQQKVHQDPVVREILRTFKATIGDVQPKE